MRFIEYRITEEYWAVKDRRNTTYLFVIDHLTKEQAERIATQLNLIIGDKV